MLTLHPTPESLDAHIVANADYFTVAVPDTSARRYPGERRRNTVLEFQSKGDAVKYVLTLRRLYRHPPQAIIYAVEVDRSARDAGCAPSQCARSTALSEKEWYSA